MWAIINESIGDPQMVRMSGLVDKGLNLIIINILNISAQKCKV